MAYWDDALKIESVHLCYPDSAGPLEIKGSGQDWVYRGWNNVPVVIEDVGLLAWIVSSSVKRGPGDEEFLKQFRESHWLSLEAEVVKP